MKSQYVAAPARKLPQELLAKFTYDSQTNHPCGEATKPESWNSLALVYQTHLLLS